MIIPPVIDRELRAQARLGFTYVLRVFSAAALLCVCIYFGAKYGFAPRFGGILFNLLNGVLLISIWMMVPLLAADCISRERREGTLGLLFLTPLSAPEIVLSKGLVHGLRAVTMWLTVLPIMTVCFLLGGVTWKEAVLSVLMNFSSICWALAAGLLASSVTKSWLRATVLAGGLAACLLLGFLFVVGLATWFVLKPVGGFYLPFPFPNGNWASESLGNRVQAILYTGFFTVTGVDKWWDIMFRSLTRGNQHAWLAAEGTLTLGSILVLLGTSFLAASNMRRGWQEEPPSARQLKLEKILVTPIIGVNFFRRWLRRKLERNPIGWLEQRTWSGRMVTWGWFAVMVSFYSAVFYIPGSQILLLALQNFMAWSLLGLIAVSASGSFQRERETRVLELLLVSPMTESEITWGRLRGLWGQFLPALLLMLGVWTYLAEIFRVRGNLGLIPFFCAAFATLPVIGLYYSLSRANFITAFLSTIATGLVLPYVFRLIPDLFVQAVFNTTFGNLANAFSPGQDGIVKASMYFYVLKFLSSSALLVIIQLAIGLRIAWKLNRDLVTRNFPFTRTGT